MAKNVKAAKPEDVKMEVKAPESIEAKAKALKAGNPKLTNDEISLVLKTGGRKYVAAVAFLKYLLKVDENGVCTMTDPEIFEAVKAEGFTPPEYHKFWYPDFYRTYFGKRGHETGNMKTYASYAADKAEHALKFKDQIAATKKERKAAKQLNSLTVKEITQVLEVMSGEEPADVARVLFNKLHGKAASSAADETQEAEPASKF